MRPHGGVSAPAGTPPRSGRSGKGWLRGKAAHVHPHLGAAAPQGASYRSGGPGKEWFRTGGMSRMGDRTGVRARLPERLPAPGDSMDSSGYSLPPRVHRPPTRGSPVVVPHRGALGPTLSPIDEKSFLTVSEAECPPLQCQAQRHGRRGPPAPGEPRSKGRRVGSKGPGRVGDRRLPTAVSFPVQRHQNCVTTPLGSRPTESPAPAPTNPNSPQPAFPPKVPLNPPTPLLKARWLEYNDRLYTRLTLRVHGVGVVI